MVKASTERMILQGVLSLPAPVLRLLSGGGVVYQGGRTLDPRLQFLAARARRGGAIAAMTPEAVRRAARGGVSVMGGELDAAVRTENLEIAGPRGPIPLRAYRPETQDPQAPLMVYAHGGGGVVGDLEMAHGFCGRLARIARGPVLSVDYRLAPEHRFPAGLEDVLTAFRWARDHAERFGAAGETAAIGGEGMGAAFAAVCCHELKAAGDAQPALQLLVNPLVDATCDSASMRTYGEAFPLDRAAIAWRLRHYLSPQDDPADPRVSPLKQPDFEGLAPAVVITAGFDPLLDQGEAYARRLQRAHAGVVYRCYDSLSHGFVGFAGVLAGAEIACSEIAGLVREGYEGRIA